MVDPCSSLGTDSATIRPRFGHASATGVGRDRATKVKIPFRREIVDGDDSAIAEKRSSVLGGDVQIYVARAWIQHVREIVLTLNMAGPWRPAAGQLLSAGGEAGRLGNSFLFFALSLLCLGNY